MKEAKKNNDYKNIEHKKRVLLVVRWPVGGIRTFMRYVYRRFPTELYHFILITPDQAETRVLLEDLASLDLTYSPVPENPTPLELGLAVFRQISSGKIDLVHSHGFTSGICSAIQASLFRVPHLMTIHETLNQSQFSGPLGALKRIAMEAALLLIDTIQSVSHDAQSNLLEFFPLIRKRCLVIPNGIEVERFQKAKSRDLRGELELGDDWYLVGFFGRFMKPKGFVYLVDAVGQYYAQQKGKKKIMVVAFGDGGFIREEKAALAERGLSDYFRFFPFTPNVASVIKGLDLVVMPSLWEACPLLPMEVLTCGIPLLSTDCIGLREVVMDTPSKVVSAGDSKALAEGIQVCIEQDQRQRFIEYAPIAARRYDVTATSAAIQALIWEKVNEKMCSI